MQPSRRETRLSICLSVAGKQEARNGYLACYADDIKDGDVDGKNGTESVSDTAYAEIDVKATADATTTTKVWAYTVEKAGHKYAFDGKDYYIDTVKETK